MPQTLICLPCRDPAGDGLGDLLASVSRVLSPHPHSLRHRVQPVFLEVLGLGSAVSVALTLLVCCSLGLDHLPRRLRVQARAAVPQREGLRAQVQGGVQTPLLLDAGV